MARVTDLDTLLAEDAVRRALVEYCRGVDGADPDRVLAAYHDDGVDHHGTWDGVAHEHLPGALQRLVDRTAATVHVLGPSTFRWDEGSVRVETNVTALHVVPTDTGTDLEQLHGRYLDRFTCRGGEWRISERTFVRDADLLVENATPAYPDGVFVRGARGPQDPGSWSGR